MTVDEVLQEDFRVRSSFYKKGGQALAERGVRRRQDSTIVRHTVRVTVPTDAEITGSRHCPFVDVTTLESDVFVTAAAQLPIDFVFYHHPLPQNILDSLQWLA